MDKGIHLVGMGVLGSVTAWMLHSHSIPFTWEDNDAPYVAWKASTGLIYPSGNPQEQHYYEQWQQWIEQDSPWKHSPDVAAALGKGSFWFSSKNPPHGAQYPITASVGSLHLGSLPTYHMNPQQFVLATRTVFAQQRQKPQPESRTIISHGYTRHNRYIWGWSAKVRIRFTQAILMASTQRPSLYMRKGRFQLAYANPVPGEPYHYAGSSMLVQKEEPKHYRSEEKYACWERLIRELAGDGIEGIERDGEIKEGWRPSSTKDDDMLIKQQGDTLMYPAMSGSGVRMAPFLCEQVITLLQKKGSKP